MIRSTRTLAVSGLTDVAASPVIHDGVVYATRRLRPHHRGRLGSGERLWEQNIGSASTPAVSGNALFIVDLEDNLVAMNRSTGEVFWRTALPVVAAQALRLRVGRPDAGRQHALGGLERRAA